MPGERFGAIARPLAAAVGATVLAIAALGCDRGSYSVTVRFSPAELATQAAWLEVGLIGDCDALPPAGEPIDGAVQSVRLERAQSGSSSLGPLRSGTYGLYAQALASDCAPVARGCERVELDGRDGGELVVVLEAVEGDGCDEASRCSGGLCVPDDVDECSGCLDDEICYGQGDARPGAPCDRCVRAPLGWRWEAQGCEAGGVCYADGEIAPGAPCDRCTEGSEGWRWEAQGCEAGRVCYADGEIAPGAPCDRCTRAPEGWVWVAATEDADCVLPTGDAGTCGVDAFDGSWICCTHCWYESPEDGAWYCITELDASACGVGGVVCESCDYDLECDVTTGTCY
jgi:hypothetical protein